MTKTPEGIEVIEGPQPGRRRRFTAEEKRRLVGGSAGTGLQHQPGGAAQRCLVEPIVSLATVMEQSELESLGADEQVVPLSEAKQLRARVRQLERLLGKKTLEAEILKEALELARSKKLLARSNWPAGGDSK
jgi:transposase